MNASTLFPRCRRARRQIPQASAGALPGDLQAHLDRCADCADYVRRVRTLEETLRRSPSGEEASPLLTDRIMREVEALGAPGVARSRLGYGAMAAAAALLLLVGLGALQGLRYGPSTTGSTPAQLAALTAGMGPGAASLAGSLPGSASERLQEEALYMAEDVEAAAGFLVTRWKASATLLGGIAVSP